MANFGQMVTSMRQVFHSGKTKSFNWRQEQLTAMLKMFDENKEALCDALKQDLNKAKFESMLMEVDYTRNDLVNCINNLSEWMKPEKVKKNMINLMDKAYIRREPFGVCLIIGAWNYPVQLTLAPLIGAIAAGNCVVLKPSELSVATAQLLEDIIPKYLDTECVKVVNGGIPETTALLKEHWDYIFYTGNSMVGKIVMKAAAEYLTPITLELGGKSPVYVDTNCDLAAVANRLMWGKTVNSGQTCIAPDYVMCTKETQDQLIEKIKATMRQFYPEGPAKSPDYARMVNDRHFERVRKLMGGGGKVAVGGETDPAQKYIAPTVLADVSFSDPVMQEEIFGPVLPIVPVRSEDEAIAYIQKGPSPLALYLFTNRSSLTSKMLETCTSGSVCVNDTFMQAGMPTLPFGGVGNSGMGKYHGKFSFDCFSHSRGCLERELKMEPVNAIRYPPFTVKKGNIISWLQQKKVKKTGVLSLVPYFIFGTLFAILLKMYFESYSA